MTRYKKSIHQALAEVGEWQPPTEPELLVEEDPIPTETGRELLKKRIAPVSYTHLTLPTIYSV